MGEAGLGAAEVGEKIAEHREHSIHAQPTGRDRIITIIEAALLAAVALMAAWSGFASAKWSTESRLQLAEANASRVEANRAAGTAAANKETDDLAFNAWFATAVLANPQAMDIAERRFRPELKVAFDAWIKTDPLNNPDAPPSPTYMPEYVQPEIGKAEELDRHAKSCRRRAPSQARPPIGTCASPCSSRACCSSSGSAATSRCASPATD